MVDVRAVIQRRQIADQPNSPNGTPADKLNQPSILTSAEQQYLPAGKCLLLAESRTSRVD